MAENCKSGGVVPKAGQDIRKQVRAGALRLLLALAFLGIVLNPLGDTAQGAGQAGNPKSAPAAFNPQKNFTIQKIEPDAAAEEVRIFFTAPVTLELLRSNLKMLPRLKVDWDKCQVSPEGVFTLKGAFRYGSGHYLSLPDGLPAGGRTYLPTVTKFTMPDRPEKVEFVEDKRVIERDSRQLLHVRTVNLRQVYLEGVRVPPLLLPQALAAERLRQPQAETLAQLQQASKELQALIRGNSAYSHFAAPALQENQLFPAGGEKNRLLAVSLPLSFRKDKERGALELITVRADQDDTATTTPPRVFRLTDLGLTYKIGRGSLLLWATSLKAGAPAAGVQVLAFTRDAAVFPVGVTGQDGVLLISAGERDGLSLKTPGAFKPVKQQVELKDITLLLAGNDSDVSFIEAAPRGNLKPKDIWQVGGDEQPRNLKGQVFTERGVYRPGEKVFFKGTVREYRNGAIGSPQGDKCVFEVVNPRGESVFTKKATFSDFGTAAGEMATQPHWAVGTYTLTMRFGPEFAAASKKDEDAEPEYDDEGDRKPAKVAVNEAIVTFQVQEFKPPRHFADIAFARVQHTDNSFVNRKRQAEFVKITMNGGYYAGGPVKHGQVRWKIHQSRTSYQVPGYDGYTFGCEGKEQGDLIESGQAILDEAGKTSVEFPLDRKLLSGHQGLWVVATVVDFDGRAATSAKSFQVDPDFLVGISTHPEKTQMGEPQDLKLVVLNRQGQKVSQGTLKAEVLQKSYAYVAKRNEQGDLYWDDETTWRKSLSSDLPLKQGQGVFQFDCGQSGKYILSFVYTDPQGHSFTSSTPFKVAWDYRMDDKQERPYEPLGLWADRPAYKPGDTAGITASPKAPVSWYLVTVEREGLLSHQVVKAESGPQTLPLALKDDYAPNVYVSVLGLSPRGDFPVYAGRYDTEAPGFVWGTVNVPVLKQPEGLEVKISPAVKELKAEPGNQVSLDLLVTTPKGAGVESEMALAVVDEAVLALTGFKTPSLDRLTRFDHPLRVFTGELRTSLIFQTPFYPSRLDPLTGGGGLSGEMLSRLRKRFEAVAYFNPSLRTDAQGRAKVTFTLPDNITSYRVYAVVADRGSRFANAERQFLSAREFYLEPGLPNFFLKGDKFRFQVAAFNAGPSQGPVKFSTTAEGLTLTGVDTSGQLQPKGSVKFNVTGEAAATGPAKFRFGGEFQGKHDAVELAIPVNSGLVRDTTTLFGSFSGTGEAKFTLPPYLTGAAAGKVNLEEVKAVLTLAGSPFARLERPVRYLLTYPYGCVEQTSSGVLGLVAVRGLVQDGHLTGISLAAVDRYLLSGIDRLFTLQTGRGGFGYWPGQHYPHNWGTIYAVSALSLAKAQGLKVWDKGLEKSLKYLREQLLYENMPPAQKAFTCYLLALNGNLEPRTFQKASQDQARMQREGKILLLLAAKQAKLAAPAALKNSLKPLLETRDEVTHADWDEDFDARYRGPALALLAARSIMPGDPATAKAAEKLLAGLGRNGLWTSTSDTGWSLLALGEYFKGAAFSHDRGEVTVSQPGVAPQILALEPKGSRSLTLNAQSFLKNPVVQLKGGNGRTWLYQVEFTAPRLDLVKQGVDQGFQVTKQVKNTDGTDTIKVGDLVKVTLTLDVGRGQKYVVLDDPLPAGLVAVNSAFKTEEPINPRGDQPEDTFDYFTPDGAIRFRPNHFEIRNDRVLAFRDMVYPGSYRFEYYARAVCEGAFTLPGVKVEAMYSPGVQGFSPQGKLTVQAR